MEGRGYRSDGDRDGADFSTLALWMRREGNRNNVNSAKKVEIGEKERVKREEMYRFSGNLSLEGRSLAVGNTGGTNILRMRTLRKKRK